MAGIQKISTKVLNDGLQVKAGTRGLHVILDEPLEDGGSNKGLNPMELLLAALAGCQSMVAQLTAKDRGIVLNGLEIEVEGDSLNDAFEDDGETKPGFGEIRLVHKYDSPNTIQELEEFTEYIERICPVENSISHAVKFGKVVVEKK